MQGDAVPDRAGCAPAKERVGSARVRGLAAFAVGLGCALAPGRASAGEWDRDFEAWYQLFVEGNLDPVARGLRTSLDLHARYLNTPRPFGPDDAAAQNPNLVFILRPALGYQFAPWGTAWLGYAWQPNYFLRDDKHDISEHRLWEQFSGSWSFGPTQLGVRTRLEQRHRDAGGEGQGEGLWALRLRQQVRFAWTLVPKGPWQLVASDEIFFHLNTTGVFEEQPDGTRKSVGYPSEAGFDQNRAFLGMGYAPSSDFRLELGYLNQIVNRMERSPDQINHVLFAGMFFKVGGATAKR